MYIYILFLNKFNLVNIWKDKVFEYELMLKSEGGQKGVTIGVQVIWWMIYKRSWFKQYFDWNFTHTYQHIFLY